MRVEYSKPFFWSMATQEEVRKFELAYEHGINCYFVRIKDRWRLVTEPEFTFLKKTHNLTLIRDYFCIDSKDCVNEKQKKLLDEGNFRKFISIEQDWAFKLYDLKYKQIQEDYELITAQSYAEER